LPVMAAPMDSVMSPDTAIALARESDDVQPVLVRRTANPAGMLSDLSLDDIQRGVQ